MKPISQSVLVLMVVGIVLLSGCSGLSDPQADSPSSEIETPTSEPTMPTTQSPTETNQDVFEGEHVSNSSVWFARAVELNLQDHEHTSVINLVPQTNNSVELHIQTDGQVPIERSLMDGTQVIAAVIYHATDDDNSNVQNGTTAPVHEPESVTIYLYDNSGDQIGNTTVNPAMARNYREGNVTAEEFAQAVMDRFEPVVDLENRGTQSPSDFLNRSELSIWSNSYAEELRNSDNGFERPFPIDGIRANATRFEILHEFEYSSDEYDQHFVSARAVVFGAYWRTHLDSWARTPERLNLYIYLPDGEEDYAATMDKENVLRLVEGGISRNSLSNYTHSYENWWVDKNETEFENF